MDGLRFIWWSVKIPSQKAIFEEAERESRRVRALIAAGEFTQQEAAAQAGMYAAQTVAPLFVFVGVVGGFTGSLLANVISYFIGAPNKSPFAPENQGWGVAAFVCLLLLFYVGLWADRMQQRYQAMMVGIAHGSGGRLV